MAETKICGIRTPADLDCAHASGARWIGMVFFHKSPRHLSLDEASTIRHHAEVNAIKTERVALVVNTDDPGLEAIINAASPQMIQCHGTETPERIAAIRTRFGLPVMKAIRVESAETLTLAQEYDDAADRMLFDSAPLDAVLPGGTGHAFDWGIMQQWNGRKPWILAGGLNAGNVADAITISGAASVDVSSGVESAPGIKDHAAIRHFVTAAL